MNRNPIKVNENPIILDSNPNKLKRAPTKIHRNQWTPRKKECEPLNDRNPTKINMSLNQSECLSNE